MSDRAIIDLLIGFGLSAEDIERVMDAVFEYAREQASDAADAAMRDYEERM